MFTYKYPDSSKELKIVVFGNNAITICKWWPTIHQWVDNSVFGKCTTNTVSYTEYDIRIKEGIVHWCYYSEFKRFVNCNRINNINTEV